MRKYPQQIVFNFLDSDILCFVSSLCCFPVIAFDNFALVSSDLFIPATLPDAGHTATLKSGKSQSIKLQNDEKSTVALLLDSPSVVPLAEASVPSENRA